MAIIENGSLRGQVGNLVNRRVGTQHIVQTKPGRKIRQTKSTQVAAEDFGYASAAGALLRQAFVHTHQQLHDDKMHNRLIKHIQRVMWSDPAPIVGYSSIREGNIDRLIGFQFNADCHLQDYLYIDPVVRINDEQQVSVCFSAFHRHKHLRIPKDCYHVVFQVETIALQFGDKKIFPLGTQEIEIEIYAGKENRIDEQILTFEDPVHPYDSILVGLCILYVDKSGSRSYVRNNKELHPAAIIGGFNRRPA